MNEPDCRIAEGHRDILECLFELGVHLASNQAAHKIINVIAQPSDVLFHDFSLVLDVPFGRLELEEAMTAGVHELRVMGNELGICPVLWREVDVLDERGQSHATKCAKVKLRQVINHVCDELQSFGGQLT